MNHNQLEWWSFVWSEVRLLIAAVALFIGGTPPLLYVAINAQGGTLGLVLLILKLAWLISGVASAYLLYRWVIRGNMLFGGKNTFDMAAFAVMTVSGLNLGFAGLFGQNIGMSLSQNYIVLAVAAIIYLVAAVYFYQRWSAHGQKIF